MYFYYDFWTGFIHPYRKHHLKDKSSYYWNAKWFNETQYCKLCLFLVSLFIIKGVQYQISLTSWLKRMQRPHKLRFTCKNVSAPELNVNAQLTDKQILAQANKVLGDQALPMPNNMSLCMTPICFNNMTSLRLKISAWWYTKGCIQLKVLNDAHFWMQIQLCLSHIFYSDKSFILPHQ